MASARQELTSKIGHLYAHWALAGGYRGHFVRAIEDSAAQAVAQRLAASSRVAAFANAFFQQGGNTLSHARQEVMRQGLSDALGFWTDQGADMREFLDSSKSIAQSMTEGQAPSLSALE